MAGDAGILVNPEPNVPEVDWAPPHPTRVSASRTTIRARRGDTPQYLAAAGRSGNSSRAFPSSTPVAGAVPGGAFADRTGGSCGTGDRTSAARAALDVALGSALAGDRTQAPGAGVDDAGGVRAHHRAAALAALDEAGAVRIAGGATLSVRAGLDVAEARRRAALVAPDDALCDGAGAGSARAGLVAPTTRAPIEPTGRVVAALLAPTAADRYRAP